MYCVESAFFTVPSQKSTRTVSQSSSQKVLRVNLKKKGGGCSKIAKRRRCFFFWWSSDNTTKTHFRTQKNPSTMASHTSYFNGKLSPAFSPHPPSSSSHMSLDIVRDAAMAVMCCVITRNNMTHGIWHILDANKI